LNFLSLIHILLIYWLYILLSF